MTLDTSSAAMKKSYSTNPALALALAFITPVFFVFSQNWYMLEPTAMLVSSGLGIVLACIIFFMASVAVRWWEKISTHVPRWARVLVAVAFCLILVETCCFFLQGQLFAAIPNPRWLRILVSRILPCIGLLLVMHRFGFSPLNVFLIVFLGISTVNLSVRLLREEQSPLIDRSLATYTINNRPNIYLFFLESYHSLDVQQKVYGIDTTDFETYLASNNFIDYGKVYANSTYTLGSLADTFRLSSSRAYARGNSDIAPVVRRMFGGNEENTLFRVLKENGYTTVFLVGDTDYFGTVKGEFLDDSDSFNFSQDYVLLSNIITSVEMLNTRFREESIRGMMLRLAKWNAPPGDGRSYEGGLESRVSRAVAIHRNPDAPLFLAFKGGARHTPSDGTYTWRQHSDSDDWVRSGAYQEAVKKGNQQLRSICDAIIADDPGAMIILLGDHGAWRFRDAEEGGSTESIQDLIMRLQEKDILLQDFCDDIHAVFLGIRLPYGRRENIAYELPMSHVNLFRHVFAYLNNDKSILATRASSGSYWKNYATIKEGKIAAAP